ncbi:MAG: sigma factor-like helix-turn-helix DNA-binding protein [Ilumatobacteraceae bacterium]
MDFTADRSSGIVFQAIEVDDVVAYVSFEQFYAQHRTPIARALTVTLRDRELAIEATDEAMARAYQRWEQVRTLDNPAGWVYRVALNWSRSILRRLTRPAPRWVSGSDTAPAPVVQDPAVERALDSLSVDQRAAVVCRLMLGYSEARTAELLGIRPGTVKSRLHRALDRLEPLLSPLHSSHEETPS